MDESAIIHYITDTFPDVNLLTASGDFYFLYDPGRKLPPERRHPFATLVTGDRHDTVSDLERPGVFRLNLGVGKETFRSLFGPRPTGIGEPDVAETVHDYAALDRILPHPVYAGQSWICILNPSDATLETLRPLIAEAYDLVVRRFERANKG